MKRDISKRLNLDPFMDKCLGEADRADHIVTSIVEYIQRGNLAHLAL